MPYYTRSGNVIYNPFKYAETGAPMYESPNRNSDNINQKHYIYQINCSDGKKYIGKTTNINQRLKQFNSGNVEPLSYQILVECNGIDSDFVEMEQINNCIDIYGFDNVITSHNQPSNFMNTIVEESENNKDNDEYHSVFNFEM